MKLQFIDAGQIVTTHGVRGEVKVLPWVDSPAFLKGFHRVCIDGREYPVELCRAQKNCCLMKLKGVDSMDDAQRLRGKTLRLYRQDAPKGAIFAAELIGMTVLCDGTELGKITEVLDYPGNQVYVVQGTYEYLIPAVREFILSTDLEQNEMRVRIIEGMRSDED